MPLQLVIANKNYSSWSMRPWVLMQARGIAFEEIKLRLPDEFGSDDPFYAEVAKYSSAGRVPVLLDDGFAVWDTLAIAEYLHEKFPQAGVWPAEPKQRARARSVCAEMHSGFGNLRSLCPMNIEASFPEIGQKLWAEHEGLRKDVARIDAIWSDALAAGKGRASNEQFLFGEFCAADAFFAPVCVRLSRFALPVSDAAKRYIGDVLNAPAVSRWIADALQERDFIADDEPYRKAR